MSAAARDYVANGPHGRRRAKLRDSAKALSNRESRQRRKDGQAEWARRKRGELARQLELGLDYGVQISTAPEARAALDRLRLICGYCGDEPVEGPGQRCKVCAEDVRRMRAGERAIDRQNAIVNRADRSAYYNQASVALGGHRVT